MKIVINRKFRSDPLLSQEAMNKYKFDQRSDIKGNLDGILDSAAKEGVHLNVRALYVLPISRHDPLLVKCVEELGKAASDCDCDLQVIEVPDGISYAIDNDDGLERVVDTQTGRLYPSPYSKEFTIKIWGK